MKKWVDENMDAFVFEQHSADHQCFKRFEIACDKSVEILTVNDFILLAQ